MFTTRYIRSVNSSDLRDDEFHHGTDALHASASSDLRAGSETILGSLLTRVKFADGIVHKDFEAGSINLVQLLALWKAEVAKRGAERKWVTIRIDRDISTQHALFKRVAERSLAHWLDSTCKTCNGTRYVEHAFCKPCAGSGQAEIECSGQFELEKIKDMLSELEGIYQAYSARAASRLRKVA